MGNARHHLGQQTTASHHLLGHGPPLVLGHQSQEKDAVFPGDFTEKGQTPWQPQLPRGAPQPAPHHLPPPHNTHPALPTCVATTKPSPPRGPAALPVLRAGEEDTVCSARAAHPTPGCTQQWRRGESPTPPGWLLPEERQVPTGRELRPGSPRGQSWKAKAPG